MNVVVIIIGFTIFCDTVKFSFLYVQGGPKKRPIVFHDLILFDIENHHEFLYVIGCFFEPHCIIPV